MFRRLEIKKDVLRDNLIGSFNEYLNNLFFDETQYFVAGGFAFKSFAEDYPEYNILTHNTSDIDIYIESTNNVQLKRLVELYSSGKLEILNQARLLVSPDFYNRFDSFIIKSDGEYSAAKRDFNSIKEWLNKKTEGFVFTKNTITHSNAFGSISNDFWYTKSFLSSIKQPSIVSSFDEIDEGITDYLYLEKIGKMKKQLILFEESTQEDILNDFDLNCVKIGIDLKTKEYVIHDDFFEFLNTKLINFGSNNSNRLNKALTLTSHRVSKYKNKILHSYIYEEENSWRTKRKSNLVNDDTLKKDIATDIFKNTIFENESIEKKISKLDYGLQHSDIFEWRERKIYDIIFGDDGFDINKFVEKLYKERFGLHKEESLISFKNNMKEILNLINDYRDDDDLFKNALDKYREDNFKKHDEFDKFITIMRPIGLITQDLAAESSNRTLRIKYDGIAYAEANYTTISNKSSFSIGEDPAALICLFFMALISSNAYHFANNIKTAESILLLAAGDVFHDLSHTPDKYFKNYAGVLLANMDKILALVKDENNNEQFVEEFVKLILNEFAIKERSFKIVSQAYSKFLTKRGE